MNAAPRSALIVLKWMCVLIVAEVDVRQSLLNVQQSSLHLHQSSLEVSAVVKCVSNVAGFAST
jgi:hypothetical protein